jgi:hypothetical protein
VVVAAGAGRYARPRRFGELSLLPPVGSRLQICWPGSAWCALFDGVVTAQHARVGPEGEELSLDVEDFLAIRLRSAPVGRWQQRDGAPVFVPEGDCVFNDSRGGLASSDLMAINGRACRVFAAADAGQAWTVADVLGYLLATGVPADVTVPGPGELNSLAGDVFAPPFASADEPIAKVIAHAAALGGLAVRGSLDQFGGGLTRGLVFYAPGVTGRRLSVGLQRAGETLDLARTNLWQGHVTVAARPGRPGALALGALKRYESTFTLQRGWETGKQTNYHCDFTRSQARNWPDVADVFRRWVLNESGKYSGPPLNLTPYHFAALAPDDFLADVPRRLWPCLSVDAGGKSLGIVVVISLDGGATWQFHDGSARVLTQECGIVIDDDALGADYFQAALSGSVRVRVTATVESDRRLAATRVGDASCPVRIIRVPSAQWAKVCADSVFHAAAKSPAECDDSADLSRLLAGIDAGAQGMVQAELTLARLSPACNVGDLVERIDGRGVELASMTGVLPHVREVEHRCDDWTTRITIGG